MMDCRELLIHCGCPPAWPHKSALIVERLGLYPQTVDEHVRNRHLRPSFHQLAAVLAEALPLKGDQAAFTSRWAGD